MNKHAIDQHLDEKDRPLIFISSVIYIGILLVNINVYSLIFSMNGEDCVSYKNKSFDRPKKFCSATIVKIFNFLPASMASKIKN